MAEERNENEEDLKSREYRDSEGNVHHHTKSYMEGNKAEHNKDRKERDESEEREEE